MAHDGWRTVCWTRNELDETTLFLYPAPQEQVNVEVVYSRTLKVTDESAAFPLSEVYEGVVADFVMYRAYNKDSLNPQKGRRHSFTCKRLPRRLVIKPPRITPKHK